MCSISFRLPREFMSISSELGEDGEGAWQKEFAAQQEIMENSPPLRFYDGSSPSLMFDPYINRRCTSFSEEFSGRIELTFCHGTSFSPQKNTGSGFS